MTIDEVHLDRWREMEKPIREAGMVSFALVAVDSNGEVFYGADFGSGNGSALLGRLDEIRSDIKEGIKRVQAAGHPPCVASEPHTLARLARRFWRTRD